MPNHKLPHALRRASQLLLLFVLTTCLAARDARTAGELPRAIKPPPRPIQIGNPVHANLVETSTLINALEARSTYAVTGNGLTAAVLDSGIRATHQDFSGRIVAQRNYTTENGGSTTNAADGDGHGTHVSGIIAANGTHTGIAPGANLVALKVLDNTGSGDFNSIRNALDWVIANRATYNISVVNMSLGDGGNYTSYTADTIQNRIQTLRNAGVAVCVAAGNDYYGWSSAQGMGYPAIFANTVSVGAVYDADVGPQFYGDGGRANSTAASRFCPFSQRLHSSASSANRTDIFAPGAVIRSTGISNDTSEATAQGTSQATPVAAGVILLMQEYYQRATGSLPSVDQLEDWLRRGAVSTRDGDDEDDNVANTNLDFPRIDALGAMNTMLGDMGSTFSVQGTITQNGAALAGVTVSAGGKSGVSNANGQYTIAGLAAATYSVVPTLTGYKFTPTSRQVTVGPSQTGVDFTATPDGGTTTYQVSGNITTSLGTPITGVSVSVGSGTATTNASGAYTITGLAAGTYTVAATRSGYTFSPTSRSITVGPDQSGINFTGTQTSTVYSLSGSVTTSTGTGLSGVTITAGGKTATTNATGAYSLTGLSPGTYSVIPEKAGYTFTPATRTVALSSNTSGVNFTGASVTYTLSGVVTYNGSGLSGVTINIGAQSATTGTSGSYSFTGLAPGVYGVTPAREGYVFSPATTSVTLSANTSGINFTASRPTYSISGTVTQDGVGLPDVKVSAGNLVATTAADGTYILPNLTAGSYTVRALRSGYTFTPATRSVNVGPDQSGIDFATASTLSVSGVVQASGVGLAGVTVSAGSASTTTGAGGAYTLSGLTAGTYTVTAVLAGYQFSPASRSVTLSTDTTGVDFTGTALPTLLSVTLKKESLRARKSVGGTLRFSLPVTAKTTVTLASSNPAVARVPASVSLAKKKSTATFTVKTRKVTASTTVTITATSGGVSRQATLLVTP